jgi:transcription elongation factor Elf1
MRCPTCNTETHDNIANKFPVLVCKNCGEFLIQTKMGWEIYSYGKEEEAVKTHGKDKLRLR